MTELECIYDRMNKLTRKDLVRTYYTVAEMRPEDPRSDRVEKCILPVDVYEKDGMGYEIMPVRLLAKHCPWDMAQTIVRIDTENTHIMENLHNIVVEDAELHQHLVALDEGRE